MAYEWARWLPEALEKEGCTVVREKGWRNRGRYRADGRTNLAPNWAYEPDGLVSLHHTGTKTSATNPWPTGRLLTYGRSDLAGPLCQVSPDHKGVMHIVAAGRANHAGKMSGIGPTRPGEDGNIRAIGFEIDTDGRQKIPVAQYRASIRGAAAVNRKFKRSAAWTLSHGETSVTGKWDPGEYGRMVNMDKWRKDVAECLSYPPGVWMSKSGKSSWGEVSLSELRKGPDSRNRATIKRLQYRLKSSGASRVPAGPRKAVKVTGVWDAATIAALKNWQIYVFAPKNPGSNDGTKDGRTMGPKQARLMFKSRFHIVP